MYFYEFYSYMQKLSERHGNADFAFIVFEPPTRECSERAQIQAWFRDNGVEVEEWKPNT